MGVTLDVPPHVLRYFKGRWDAAGDKLDGSWRRLAKASTSGFSPEVARAVEAFQDEWADEIKACALRAEAASEAFVESEGDFRITDEAEAERLRGLLSWDYRDARIGRE